jgi:hypothetical protein
MKYFIYSIFIGITFSCNSESIENKLGLSKDGLKRATDVASIGLFEKLEYKFFDADSNNKSYIQLHLYNTHLSKDKFDSKEVAIKTSKEFLKKFTDSKKYDSLFVKIIQTEKGNLKSVKQIDEYRFLTIDL